MNSVLMVTHTQAGDLFGGTDGTSLTKQDAQDIQSDLFVKPQEDGLFPGHSQTWKREG